jgi:putative transposase
MLPVPVVKPADVVGVDLGLQSAAVIHDGREVRVVDPQRALRRNLAKLRRLDRQLARKQEGSNGRRKAKLQRARLHYRIACQRSNHLHQLSSQLARTKSVIVLEDLHLRGMQRNKHLALSISDAGMGELRRQLTYKSTWYGSRVVVADRFFPSSKLCSGCGVIKDTFTLRERVYDCDVCGLSLDRDENAAINLRRLGLSTERGGTTGGSPGSDACGEEGSGARITRRETSLAEPGSDSGRRMPSDSQKHGERRAGEGLSWDQASQRESGLQRRICAASSAGQPRSSSSRAVCRSMSGRIARSWAAAGS